MLATTSSEQGPVKVGAPVGVVEGATVVGSGEMGTTGGVGTFVAEAAAVGAPVEGVTVDGAAVVGSVGSAEGRHVSVSQSNANPVSHSQSHLLQGQSFLSAPGDELGGHT